MSTPINLLSIYADRDEISGPQKVFQNLVKGLVKIGQPYVVNKALAATGRIWVQRHPALREVAQAPTAVSLLGPNIAVLPNQVPIAEPLPRSIYVHPSTWVASLWAQEGFALCPLRAWPVGIDTETFAARLPPAPDAPVMIYFKERFPHELYRVLDVLEKRRIRYTTVIYGNYKEVDYRRLLNECSFAIWLGRQESQGIALQEALAMNVPLLVLDALSLYDCCPVPRDVFPERLRAFRTTSAPYFDARCGHIIDLVDRVDEGIEFMCANLSRFRPREFILENLTLERQARAFVELFEDLESAT